MDTQIKAWSYSRYSSHKFCPYKAKLTIIDGFKEPPNKAMGRGNDIHKKGENFLKGDIKEVPKEYKKFFNKHMLNLRKHNAYPEDNICVDKNWKLCNWNDWGKVWGRIRLDVNYEFKPGWVKFIDFKTGKVKESDHYEQLDLYALAIFLSYDELLGAEGELWYLDSGHILTRSYTYSEKKLASLKKWWLAKIKKMMADKVFPYNPNYYCGSCHFRKSNNGPCKYQMSLNYEKNI